MFTGIVSAIGTIVEFHQGDITKVKFKCPYNMKELKEGSSIAHDGICLTIINLVPHEQGFTYDVEVSTETIKNTNIKTKKNGWMVGKQVNLERSLRQGDELGGRIVTGHVDGIAKLRGIEKIDKSLKLTLEAPKHLIEFIATKGSVALNGTSLTVNDMDRFDFSVNLIPHTQEVTTWKFCRIGDFLNIEIDLMARYISRLHKNRDPE